MDDFVELRLPEGLLPDVLPPGPLQGACEVTEPRAVLQGRFDPRYYRAEYPDLDLPDDALLEHFLEIGWREGRNPAAGFDTLHYLTLHADVAGGGTNPYVHYLAFGTAEGRRCEPAASPTRCALRLFGRPVADWVERLRPYVDPLFYAGALGTAFHTLHRVDLVAHYAYRGWREGVAPNRDFDTRLWLATHPGLAGALVNPLLIEIEQARVAAAGPPVRPLQTAVPEPSPIPPDHIDLIRTQFSAAYYLRHYPDVARSGLDPLTHYVTQGWRLGYWPNAEFDTQYYVDTSPDVVAAGLNPFWHYLAHGQQEGRRTVRAGGYRRGVLDAARPPVIADPGEMRAVAARNRGDIGALRGALAQPRRGLVLSFSHDRYTMFTGGTQIFIGDEQRKFHRRGWRYLHVSPACPALTTVEAGDDFALWVTFDGAVTGCFNVTDLLDAIASDRRVASAASLGDERVLVVHSLLGFDADAVCGMAAAFAHRRAFYWLHDYSSLCPGFNLLRNDLVFCHAPPPASLACRVCVYGALRRRHLDAVARVFGQIGFTVLAPSQAAADVWLAANAGSGTALPHQEVIVRPHWRLRPVDPAEAQAGDENAGGRRRSRSLSVAFVGSQFPSKGWPAFRHMTDTLGHVPEFHFLVFASEDADPRPGVTFVPVRVTVGQRAAMVEALRGNAVDFVAILSPWPETFSFVVHEALMAGCLVACLEASGNVAALVRATGRGAVFARDEDVLAFFASGAAAAMAHRLRDRTVAFQIEDTGTTEPLLADAAMPG